MQLREVRLLCSGLLCGVCSLADRRESIRTGRSPVDAIVEALETNDPLQIFSPDISESAVDPAAGIAGWTSPPLVDASLLTNSERTQQQSGCNR